MANVTKRTVDYYTNLGLLKAERSPSNYRFYGKEELARLKTIHTFKENNYSLDEIRELLELQEAEKQRKQEAERELELKLHHLNDHLEDVIALLEKNNVNTHILKKQLPRESIALIQSLLLLLL